MTRVVPFLSGVYFWTLYLLRQWERERDLNFPIKNDRHQQQRLFSLRYCCKCTVFDVHSDSVKYESHTSEHSPRVVKFTFTSSSFSSSWSFSTNCVCLRRRSYTNKYSKCWREKKLKLSKIRLTLYVCWIKMAIDDDEFPRIWNEK